MGKIRIRTLGDESAENKIKKEVKVKKEQKKAREEASPDVIANEVKQSQEIASSPAYGAPRDDEKEEKKKLKTPSASARPRRDGQSKKVRSKKYQSVKILVDPNKKYMLAEALELLPKLKLSTFDETVEMHINTTEVGISGTLTLPHGNSKKVRVAVATDELIAQIEKGKVDFDVLVAEPSMMPKLAKLARVLGPRGLMPNPKNGTVTDKPQDVIKKYEAGQLRFKTEAKSPVIHLTVGKISFGDKKLSENIQTVLKTIQSEKIRNITLKSTMSPAIKLAVS